MQLRRITKLNQIAFVDVKNVLKKQACFYKLESYDGALATYFSFHVVQNDIIFEYDFH